MQLNAYVWTIDDRRCRSDTMRKHQLGKPEWRGGGDGPHFQQLLK